MKTKNDERRADRLLNLNNKPISNERKKAPFSSKAEGAIPNAHAQEKD